MSKEFKEAKEHKESYWAILEQITEKNGWYEKVFNENLVNKWYQEIVTQGGNKETTDNFWLCIRILRATAQGTFHDPECAWDENKLCDKCFENLKNDLLKKDNKTKEMIDEDEEIDYVYDYIWDNDLPRCEHNLCKCKSPDSELADYIEYRKNKLLSKKLVDNLKGMVNSMRDKNPVDWHPWSNEQVRDIIHPSLYCYIKGVSKFNDGSKFTGPIDEQHRYQWLPSEITINDKGKVKFKSYINNLNEEKYIPLFERTLTAFIPLFEKVLNRFLRDTKCQVLVKVGSIHLDKDKPEYNGGAWHIEGMPYEHIVATGLHYLEVENISPSFLEFRKPTVINEMCDYPQSDAEYTGLHYGITDHFGGTMNRYLGLIKADEGASVVFPNSLQHHVKEFKLVDKNDNKQGQGQGQNQDSTEGLRTIIAFFLIDPDHRIISTGDIPKQYDKISLEEAKEYREKLMFQRKYFVDEINKQVYERPYSLCEH